MTQSGASPTWARFVAFQEGRLWGAVMAIACLAVILAPLAAAAVMRTRFGAAFGGPTAYEIGRALPLIAVGIIALQFVLTARLQWLSRPFGLDRVLRWHKALGVVALALVAAHPLLLAGGAYGWSLLYGTQVPWPVWLGKAALALLLLQIVTGLGRERLLLGFERWRLLHNQAVLIFGLAFIHGLEIGTDLADPAIRRLWPVLTVVLIAYAYHKFVAPAVGWRRPYHVVEVKQETHNVWTLRMEPPPGRERWAYRPGQFHFLHLRRGRGLPAEEHHFTISSSPTQPALASTIKESGDFTATIGHTRPGDPVRIEGPFGRFTHTLRPRDRDLVFIAGGIGITPLMAMLRHMRDTQAEMQVLLLFGNRTARDIAFRDELDHIAAGERLSACGHAPKGPRLRVVHILSEPDQDWRGEKGFLDRNMIQRLVGEGLTRKTYYVCGPPPMARKVIAALRQLGVPRRSIEYERFAL